MLSHMLYLHFTLCIVPKRTLVLQRLHLDFLERDDPLLVESLPAANHDAAIHQDVAEEEELARLQPFPTGFREDPLADEHAAGAP